MTGMTRGRFAASGAAAIVSLNIVRGSARAAEFAFKCGSNLPVDHPAAVRATQIWSEVERASNGRIHTQFFPNSALGGDLAMLSQLRVGALEFQFLSPGILQGLVPATGITDVGFAFKDEAEVLGVMDGALGDYVRKEILAKGIYAQRKIWDSGMKQITSSSHPIRTADDMTGFRIRSVESKITVDFFKTLGASPTPLSFNELYTALQTKIVDGADGPMVTMAAARFYEVQKYLSLTNHTWGGAWLLANGDLWKRLPPDLQNIIERASLKYALLERRDTKVLNLSVSDKLRRLGLAVNRVDPSSFRARLRPYYVTWAEHFGPAEWGLLQAGVAGKLN